MYLLFALTACGGLVAMNDGRGLCYTEEKATCTYRACCGDAGACWYVAGQDIYPCNGEEGAVCQTAFDTMVADHCEEGA